MHRRLAPLLASAPLALAATPAAAHITLMDPPPRTASQKAGPCGAGPDDMRGDVVTVFQGGQTITLKWTETVNHPGHYRISFDADGQDDFADPAAFDDYYSNDAVLLDQIADENGQNVMYEAQVTLPEMSCDNCTLQLVQMMTDKPPYGDGNDLYYQCADIVIEGVVANTTGAATDGGSTGGADTSGGTSGDGTTGDGTTTTTTDPGSTSHASHGGTDPTTGGGSSDGTAAGSSSGAPSTTSDPNLDDDKGCGCRSDGGAGWGLLALLPALARRRRRA